MSSTNPSTQNNDRVVTLNNENSAALVELMFKYDELVTLMTESGYDTEELQESIKCALQMSVVLMANMNATIENGATGQESQT